MAPLSTAPLRRALLSSITGQPARTSCVRQFSRLNQRSTTTARPQSSSRKAIPCQPRHLSTTPAPASPASPASAPTNESLQEEEEAPLPSANPSTTTLHTTSSTQTPPPQPTQPTSSLSPSLLSTLPLLHLQSAHPSSSGLYATIHIHARPYLVTLGDKIRLPFLMPSVQPGDVLRLTHASTLGSREYTLRGAPWVDSRVFECRVTVAGVESEPMRVMQKTKRRNRKIKSVRSKHRYTELCVSELRVRGLGELQAEGVVGVDFGGI